MTDKEYPTTLPDFSPTLPGFRAEEFLTLTETLLAVPIEQNQVALDAAPFRLVAPEPLPEGPLSPLPPRWYPRPVPDVLEAARAGLVPPPKPAIFEGRMVELERVLRPLLAGHPMRVHGEMGVGKTTLLAAVATHERTRGRFRRVWWIDRPARLDQTLALALNLPHALAEGDPTARRAILAEHLDDHTLLIVDNTYPGDPALDGLLNLTQHVLLGVDTAPEVLDPDDPLPDDPEGVVTLRVFDDTSAINVLALYGGIEDTRKIRGELMRIANTLGNYPLALMLAGKLISRDGLSLDDLQEALVVRPPTGSSEDEDEEEKLRRATLNRALDVSVSALPGDYRTLFETFGAFPAEGAPLDGLLHTARIGSLLATRRGLILLAEYGFIRADHRDPQFYVMHPAIHIRAAEDEPYAPKHAIGKRMHAWALNYARANTENLLALYRAETALRFASETSGGATNPLLDVLRPYLREYVPGAFPGDESPWLDKTRSEGANLTQYGLELTDQGAYFAAEEALTRALDIRREHDSNHAVAETLVALGRLYDTSGRCPQAAESMVNAAELVYNLGAELVTQRHPARAGPRLPPYRASQRRVGRAGRVARTPTWNEPPSCAPRAIIPPPSRRLSAPRTPHPICAPNCSCWRGVMPTRCKRSAARMTPPQPTCAPRFSGCKGPSMRR